MKKTTTKTSKTPAPAKTEAKAPKTATTPVPVAARAAAPVPAPAPASKPAVSAPVVKKSAAKPIVTTIAAQIDVGFGNALYIRGEGPGLSWDQGVLMTCVSDDKWSIELSSVTKPVSCKFLLNDLVWCGGEDFVVAPGRSASFAPAF